MSIETQSCNFIQEKTYHAIGSHAVFSLSSSVRLVDQSGAITSSFSWQFIPKCTARILACETKAHATWPIVDLVKRISPAYSIAYPARARRYLCLVVYVERCAEVYTFVETFHGLSIGIVDAINIDKGDVACFAEGHLGVTERDIVERAIRGRAVAEDGRGRADYGCRCYGDGRFDGCWCCSYRRGLWWWWLRRACVVRIAIMTC